MVTQKDLVKTIAEKTGFTQKDVKTVLDTLSDTTLEHLANKEEVAPCKFFKIGTRLSSERAGRNPQTGESIVIPAQYRCFAKFGKVAKEAVN